VSVEEFRAVLLAAAARTDVVQPPALRESVGLWLRSVEERSRRENWRHLTGKPVEYAREAAQAILAADDVARPFVEQVMRGYGQTERRHRNTGKRWWSPILLTEGQTRRLFSEAAAVGPHNEEELIAVARKGEATMFGLPVQLVDTQAESTPYLEGWI
jgi:hypothetical protein